MLQLWRSRTYITELPNQEGLGKNYYTGRTGKPDGEGFSRGSTVSVARLNKGHSNLRVSSPNQYALLESEVSSSTGCNTNGSQPVSNKTISFTKSNYAKIHQCSCKRESCYWHHSGDQFKEKEYEERKEKPQVNGTSPELPDAGEESRSRVLTSVQKECRSLNCDTAQRAEQDVRSISNQKNQNQRPKGSKKEPERNQEV